MSHTIRTPLVWFLALAGLGILFGCKKPPDLTGSTPPSTFDAAPYDEVAREQYETISFIDHYVTQHTAAPGKHPNRKGLRQLVLEASGQLLTRRGLTREEIRALHEPLAARLREVSSTDETHRLPALLAKQGFSSHQQQYIQHLMISAKTARSFKALQENLRRTARRVRGALSEQEALPVVYIAARIEGIGRFLEERQSTLFATRASRENIPGPIAYKAAGNVKCRRGPDARTQYHHAWKYLKNAVTGFALGCGVGSAMFSWSAMGSMVACPIGGSWGTGLSIYWRYRKAEERYLTSLREWCDECVYTGEASASGVGTCRVNFPGDYPDH